MVVGAFICGATVAGPAWIGKRLDESNRINVLKNVLTMRSSTTLAVTDYRRPGCVSSELVLSDAVVPEIERVSTALSCRPRLGDPVLWCRSILYRFFMLLFGLSGRESS